VSRECTNFSDEPLFGPPVAEIDDPVSPSGAPVLRLAPPIPEIGSPVF
jgi:hypothetical protein